MGHPRRLGDSLEGDEFQVVEVNESRLDVIFPVRQVSWFLLHVLVVRFSVQHAGTQARC